MTFTLKPRACQGRRGKRSGLGVDMACIVNKQNRHTSLKAVHGKGVAACRKDLAHLAHFRVFWSVQFFAHKKAFFEMLQSLKGLALLLHCSVHLVMMPQLPL